MFEAIMLYIQGEIKGIEDPKMRIKTVDDIIDNLYKFKTKLILEVK